jgi:hypothetical protein
MHSSVLLAQTESISNAVLGIPKTPCSNSRKSFCAFPPVKSSSSSLSFGWQPESCPGDVDEDDDDDEDEQ